MATDNHTPAVTDDNNEGMGTPHNASVSQSWRTSLDVLQSNLAHNPAEAVELFTWCFLWCIDPAHSITLDEFARQIGADKTTVSRLIQGTYKHPDSGERMLISDRLLKAMRTFRELATERAREVRTGFVPTPTARRIWTSCDLARESRTPVFLIGPSHIGKTWALVEYSIQNNHGATIYVRMNAASGLMGMVRGIAEALGYSGKTATPDLIRRIKLALKKRPNTVLLIDELHQLFHTYRKESFFACLEVLRELYDETGVGMVLCGTELLFTRVKNNRGELEQFLRRGVHKVILPDQPQRADIAAIAETLSLEFPARGEVLDVRVGRTTIKDSAYDVLKQLGREEGLKAITERLRYATRLANREKCPLGWVHFLRAHHQIGLNACSTNDWDN